MADFYENKQVTEEVILVGVALGETSVTDESLDELEELAKTAGAVTVGRLIQNREMIHPGTYLGKGKLEELAFLISETHATGIICDDELSPAQMANMEDVLDIKVMDRTLLILDIFAQRATTREGKIQVELAQLRYRATRLVGMRNSLSRLGGGIGTRGPGEKKLELDRRLIRERISMLNRQLKSVVATRETMRKQRLNNGSKVVAIVGYTNAGKSTLLNALTHSDVLEEDMLFATLDPTTRSYELENGQKILFTDTVGFINKLPHHLIQAFRSTLEEARYADMILHVVDCSDEHYETHMNVVYETLKNLDVQDKPVLTVFNKIDRLQAEGKSVDPLLFKDAKSKDVQLLSAKKKQGFDELLEKIEKILNEDFVRIEKTFSYQEAGKIQIIREYGRLDTEEYRDDGIYVEAAVPAAYVGKVKG